MAKIRQQLNYGWRLVATAISFSSFGLGGVILWLVIFPLLRLWPGNQRQQAQRCQRMVHYSFKAFIELMRYLGVMSYSIKGVEKLNRPGQLVIANHPSLIDVVFLLSRIRQASCIVKASLLNNPAMRGSILNAGYISNADSISMISNCADYLRQGGSLLIFPEGTRSIANQAYRFQRGAAAIAIEANCIITPVSLHCYPGTLRKTDAWYQIPHQRFHLTMEVGDDIELKPYTQQASRAIAVRRLTQALQNHFEQQRERYEQH